MLLLFMSQLLLKGILLNSAHRFSLRLISLLLDLSLHALNARPLLTGAAGVFSANSFNFLGVSEAGVDGSSPLLVLFLVLHA